MSNNPFQEQINHGEELYQQGKNEEALKVFEEVLENDPENVEALNDLGVVYADLEQSDKAIEKFEKVLELQPSNEDAFYNLLDVLVSNGQLDNANSIFEKYESKIESTDLKPNYQALLKGKETREISLNEKKKIAFICGPDTKFITDIEDALEEDFQVRRVHFNNRVELNKIQEAMDWADVTWFEWCDQILINASQNLKKSSKVICRIHSYEVFTNYPHQVNWQFVDHLIFVAKHIESIFRENFEILVPSRVIENGLVIDRFKFTKREKTKHLAYVGYVNYKKNPELLLQCMANLASKDDEYKLHIAGTFQDLRYKYYFEKMVVALHLQKNIEFYGWVKDIDNWLEDKSYIISTSVLESFGFGIAESMLKGLKPVIHNWVGAENIYPKNYLFNVPEEFSKAILSNDYDSLEYRNYIVKNYNLIKKLKQVISLVQSLFNDDLGINIILKNNDGDILDKSPIFFVSTGRCGTKFLTKYFNKYRDVHAFHEPSPTPYFEKVIKFRQGAFRSEKILKRINYIKQIQGKYIETNNTLSFFIHDLAELLPYARFVHIIRNPIDYVKSESSRNRYGVGDNLDIRIPVMGNSIIEKNAYAYLAINDKITKLLAEIPDSRKQFIKFEEIFNDESKIGSLTHWCGIRYREKHWNNLRNHRINESGKARTFNLDNIEKVIEITQKYYNLFQ